MSSLFQKTPIVAASDPKVRLGYRSKILQDRDDAATDDKSARLIGQVHGEGS